MRNVLSRHVIIRYKHDNSRFVRVFRTLDTSH